MITTIHKIFIFVMNYGILCNSHGRFFLQNLRLSSGNGIVVIGFAEEKYHESHMKPICFNMHRSDNQDISLLSHKLCKEMQYQTVSRVSSISISKFPGKEVGHLKHSLASSIECRQDVFNHTITCELKQTSLPCIHLLQVECGDCHVSHIIRKNSTLLLRSPLYPLLQPDLICKYDLYLQDKQRSGQLVVEELSLMEPIKSEYDNENHCLNSFLQIQSGESSTSLSSSITLCGELKHYTVLLDGHFVRLLLVTGDDTWNRSGFEIRVGYSNDSSVFRSKIFLFFVTFFTVFFGFGSILACCGFCWKNRMKLRVSKPKQQPQRLWIGDLPVPGESIHVNRTRRLQRLLESRENSYVMDNRISLHQQEQSNTGRPLPSLPGRSSEKARNQDFVQQLYQSIPCQDNLRTLSWHISSDNRGGVYSTLNQKSPLNAVEETNPKDLVVNEEKSSFSHFPGTQKDDDTKTPESLKDNTYLSLLNSGKTSFNNSDQNRKEDLGTPFQVKFDGLHKVASEGTSSEIRNTLEISLQGAGTSEANTKSSSGNYKERSAVTDKKKISVDIFSGLTTLRSGLSSIASWHDLKLRISGTNDEEEELMERVVVGGKEAETSDEDEVFSQ